MRDRKQPDPNQVAARVIRETAAKNESQLPADVEAAWAQWSSSIQNVDQRTMALLRAAFEAGVEVGSTGGTKK